MHRLLLHACRLPLLAAIALTSAGTDGPNVVPGAAKPGMPVTISIESTGEFLRGESCEITVIAVALIDSDDFSLDVELPREIALYSGDLHRQGPVRANTRFRLGLVIRVPTEGDPVITATARLRAGNAGAFEATIRRNIDDRSPAAPVGQGVLTGRAGERLREFPLP